MYQYKFDINKCWYIEHCEKVNSEDCNAGCVRYMEMHYLMGHSNIPENRQFPMMLTPTSEDVKAFIKLREVKEDISTFISDGKSLYIHSKHFGNGKTTWAIKMLQSFFDKVWAGNGFRCRGVFIHVPTLLNKIKDNFNNKDENFTALKNSLTTVDVVVWDDIAATKLSDYDHSVLLSFIDQRTLNCMSNIYTGNLSGEELSNAVGNRLFSRIWNESTKVELLGVDRRKEK